MRHRRLKGYVHNHDNDKFDFILRYHVEFHVILQS